MNTYKNILLLTIVLLCYPRCIVYSEQNNHASLYGYHGHLTIPSAYIDEGSFGFHYTYLPNGVGPFHNNLSDNWIFTSSLGLFSFMECYFSFYVSPDYEWKVSGRGDTTRSPGVKFKILNERQFIPAVAIGVFDPGLDDTKLDYHEAPNSGISSTFLVCSMTIGNNSYSIGYGIDYLNAIHSRIHGIFGGVKIYITDYLSLMTDYDGDIWVGGGHVNWRGLNISLAYVGEYSLAYRIGYNYNLFTK